jgi:hypothetical protein
MVRNWLGRQDSNLRMTESKSVALPLGYSPSYHEWVYQMGRPVGIEPTNAGATIRCVNHFAMAAIMEMAELTGLEPATSGVTGRRELQLHHSSIFLVDGDGIEPPTPCV